MMRRFGQWLLPVTAVVSVSLGCLLGTSNNTPVPSAVAHAWALSPQDAAAGFFRPPSVTRAILVITNPDPQQQLRVSLDRSRIPAPARWQPIAVRSPLPKASPVRRSLAPAAREAVKPAPETRQFFVHRGSGAFTDPRFFHAAETQLAGASGHAAIYVHPDAVKPAPDRIAELLREFERQRQAVRKTLGATARDVDGDGRFCILVVPHGEIPSAPLGYVRPADFSPRLSPPVSNQADMMYLSDKLPRGDLLHTILAHEYTHAVCSGLRPELLEDDWLSEGLAHCVERTLAPASPNLDYRIARFLERPHQFPLTVTDYYAAGLWREHGCRGATFLFVDSCRERYGPVLLSRLATSDCTGPRSVASATGTQFRALVRQWSVGLLEPLHARPRPGHEPAVDGRFLHIGPAPIAWDGAAATQLVIAPSATGFVELPQQKPGLATQLTVLQGHSPQVTLVPLDSISLKVTVSNGQVRIDGDPARGPAELVVGFEADEAGRPVSLGIVRRPVSALPAQIALPSNGAGGPARVHSITRTGGR